jgi:hypothetical protein
MHIFLSSSPPVPEDGELPQESASDNEAPDVDERRDGDEVEGFERTGSPTSSLPYVNSKGAELRGKEQTHK